MYLSQMNPHAVRASEQMSKSTERTMSLAIKCCETDIVNLTKTVMRSYIKSFSVKGCSCGLFFAMQSPNMSSGLKPFTSIICNSNLTAESLKVIELTSMVSTTAKVMYVACLSEWHPVVRSSSINSPWPSHASARSKHVTTGTKPTVAMKFTPWHKNLNNLAGVDSGSRHARSSKNSFATSTAKTYRSAAEDAPQNTAKN